MGERIKELRLARGLKPPDLARLAGVSSEYIRKLERGDFQRPSMAYLQKVADALKISIAELVGDTDPERAIADAKPPNPKAQLADSIFKALDEPGKDEAIQFLQYLKSKKKRRGPTQSG